MADLELARHPHETENAGHRKTMVSGPVEDGFSVPTDADPDAKTFPVVAARQLRSGSQSPLLPYPLIEAVERRVPGHAAVEGPATVDLSLGSDAVHQPRVDPRVLPRDALDPSEMTEPRGRMLGERLRRERSQSPPITLPVHSLPWKR